MFIFIVYVWYLLSLFHIRAKDLRSMKKEKSLSPLELILQTQINYHNKCHEFFCILFSELIFIKSDFNVELRLNQSLIIFNIIQCIFEIFWKIKQCWKLFQGFSDVNDTGTLSVNSKQFTENLFCCKTGGSAKLNWKSM